MGQPFNMSIRRRAAAAIAAAALTLLGACAQAAPPTPTPYPTHTPAPTGTPYPTQPPLPTSTALTTFTPAPSPSATPTATPAPPLPPAPPAAPPAAPAARSLSVDWTNIHYNCQNQCLSQRTAAGTYVTLYAYRSFEFNMRVQNLTADRTLDAGWAPKVLIVDGAAQYPNAPTQIGVSTAPRFRTTLGPAVPPGQTVDHTFVVFLPGTAMFVKTITLEALGQVYTLDLKSRPDSVGYGFMECGLRNARFCPNGMPPWDPYAP